MYTGLSQVRNSTRYGFEYGPTLLSAVIPSESSWDNATDCFHLVGIETPSDPASWLEPVPGKTLQWRPKASTGHQNKTVFMPYYQVNAELMTVFPCFDKE